MYKKPYIASDRIILRLAEKNDTDEVYEYHLRNKDYLAPFEPKHNDRYYTRERWEKLNHRSLKDAEEGKAIRLFIFRKEDNKRVIGELNFEFIMKKPMCSCEIGYSMDEHEQGKGYMTEAVKLGTDYVFRELNLMRISGGYSKSNEKSGNVMRKAGFVGNNLIKNYMLINGKWEDIIYCYLYNNNWKDE
ncbi:GNAT family N-acetyltransferase [Vallitalea guaymasensis]|uniref:GNAT family N-acetyltransferase n=1 Tax=Vallitalea guaymasensis TaxID=1185412 RepID=UPI002352E6A6|nr:GNAT family protein [Vallitalea guaymasensis]